MNKHRLVTKTIAWSLIATLANPILPMAPAFARDSDIYLTVTNGGTTTAEPNVLFILTTNDRMNIPEAWREYPGAYDSHVEYLWNDINVISNNTAGTQLEVTAESLGAISDAAVSVSPFSAWGFWDGAAALDRQNLWKAVKTYANATDVEGGVNDPGPRYVFRNYFNDFSWLYWLPANTATSDPRLSSVSFNRFRAGPSNYTSSTRGGITYPPSLPTAPYNYATVNSGFAAFNLCAQTNNVATSPLIPSTVMAPTAAPQNAGVWLNQQWIRYEQYLNLATVGNSGYPGSSSVFNTYYQGYLDSSFVPPTNGLNVPPINGAAVTLGFAGPPYRDSLNSTTLVSTGATGLPIRIQRTAVSSPTTTHAADVSFYKSYAGWTDVAADLGGYTFTPSVLNGLGTTGYPYSCTLTGGTCTAAGNYAVLQTVLSWYGVTTQLGSSWPLTAFKGNRDSAPAFGSMTGTPAYYDTTQACDPTTGAPGTATGTCQGIVGSGLPTLTATWTLACKYQAGYSERDAQSTLRIGGGACTPNGAAVCSDARTVVPGGYSAPHLNCGDFAAPTTCAVPTTQDTFYTQYINTQCAASGQTPVTVGTCAWSGRQSVYVEGGGYYYYGGACTESGLPNSCTAGGSTQSLNGTSQNNVLGPYTPTQDTTYVTGRPTAPVFTTAGNALGCTNAIAAGTYNYGGTCGGGLKYNVATTYTAGTRPSYPTAAPNPNTTRTTTNPLTSCAFSGGTSLTIRGNAQTFNRSCATTESNTGSCTARYGAPCDNSTALTTASGGACVNSTTINTYQTATVGGTNYYQAYKLNATSANANLYHECISDGPLALNTGSGYPTSFMRTFAQALSNSATATAATNLSQAYVTTLAPVAQRYTADSTKNIDVYSVNYLNWLFGAKACRAADGSLITSGIIPTTATCSPIGRKTRLQIAKDAMSSIIQSTDGVRVGLEVANKTDTTSASGSAEGGNISYAIHRMGTDSSDTPAYNNRAALVNAIQAITASSRTPLTETLYEAYRYFSGRYPVFGTLSTTAKVGGTVSAGFDTSVGTNSDATPNTVYLRNSSGNYNSPMMNNPSVATPAGCQKNFIVMITNGQPEDDFSANDAIKTMRWRNTALGQYVAPRTDLDSNYPNSTAYNQIPATTGGNPYGPTDLAGTAYDGGYIWMDELGYFMTNADVSPGAPDYVGENTTDLIDGRQSINTYTIGFAGISAPVLQNAAQTSNGVFYIANNAQQLSAALTAAFVAIRNWNPTAAVATVPIDTLNRGQSSDEVYLAFFGPSPQDTWQGTVKKYHLGSNETDCGAGIDLCLIGQTVLSSGNKNIDTVDPLTGQTIVDPTATSFWGPSNLGDGSSPTKGGTGYELISNTPSYTPDTRKVYTFLSGGVSSSTNLADPVNSMHPANTAITAAMLGTGSAVTRETLINYIRGGLTSDANCSDGDPGTTCTTWATWPHFDVQHSRPVIVNYDVTQSPPVQYVFYLQNNGMLTAVDASTGQEKWSFLIEEALPQLSAMQASVNGPELYIADGVPSVFFDDQNGDGIINGSDRVWLFFGLRRGGRVLYALDITNKDQPLFKWKITADSGTGKVCMGAAACGSNTQFSELGQTWSTPIVGPIRKLGAATGYIPALIFAGGYDPLEDTMPWVGDSVTHKDTMGRAVYVINADTTQIINSWGAGQGGSYRTGGTITTYSIPSDVTALNTDNDAQGFLDRIYVGDLGGNVWRFDIDGSSETTWRGERLASLSQDTSGVSDNRKFFFPPAVAPQNAPFRFDAVYIGSGDKEHPICSSLAPATPGCSALAATDRIFMLMDDPSLNSGGGTPSSSGGSAIATPITCCTGSTTLVTLSDTTTTGTTEVALSGKQGWNRKLDAGEKVTNSPTVFFNELRFGTYAPNGQNNSCTPPGQGRLNQIDALYGGLEILNGGSMSASQRYYANFLTRGYISTGQLVVVGSIVYHLVVSDAQLQYTKVATIGGATKIYWYMEPEQ